MDAFTAALLLAGGFILGYGVMWAYCRFFQHTDRRIDKVR